MISKRLVTPTYKSIKLMEIFNFIPASLDLRTGKFIYNGRWTTRWIHNTVLGLSLLKILQILCALIWLLMNFNIDSLHVVILTAICLSLFGTSSYWSLELFHKGREETIMLFNSLEFGPSDRLTNQVLDWRSIKDWKSASLWARAAIRLGLSLNPQELLCVATPFGVKLFVPLYIGMMIVFPDWSIFATSLMSKPEGIWGTMGFIMMIMIDIMTAFFTESNILFLFFFCLAFQFTHFARAEAVIGDMR